MPKILLVAVNAKYIHTNIAVRYLKKYAEHHYNIDRDVIETCEYTINNTTDYILENIAKKKPDMLCFSAYIWNIEMLKCIADDFKRIFPDVPIFFGGPEVSYDAKKFLEENSFADGVMAGEGENSFGMLCRAFLLKEPLFNVKSLIFRDNITKKIISNPMAEPTDMALLDFPYSDDFSDAGNKILYYESSRGCPFNCQYCLSSVEKGVRFRPLDLVFKDLKRFLDYKPRQVKFVDRTFNCNKKHAMAIWKFLKENDNGYTNFHFEMSADLLDRECTDFLADVRAGLFQFEIGVQTTNEKTADTICRTASFERISDVVKILSKPKNIHLHLDLIAGLPFENYNSFRKSFNDVYALKPHQFQLGFLKLLKGSGLNRDADRYGIVSSAKAPYEVLKTNELNYFEIMKLKDIEDTVEIYYNSTKFTYSVAMLSSREKTPFDFYEKFAEYRRENGFFDINTTRYALFDILYDFACTRSISDEEDILLKELMLFDLCRHEKPKKLPDCLTDTMRSPYKRDEILENYKDESFVKEHLPSLQGKDAKYIHRVAHTEYFCAAAKDICGQSGEIGVVFDYDRRDITSNAHYDILY